jgi:ABC-type multidrug transport system ATPase subunit
VLADRIGIIHHGSLIALGTLEKLRCEQPQRNQRLEDIFLSMVA